MHLAADDWTPPEGATDQRLIAVLDYSEGSRPTIQQWQRDTIVARAIVGAEMDAAAAPDEEDGDDESDAPPCGNPMNEGGGGVEHNPLDDDTGHSDTTPASDSDPTPPGGTDRNPLDSPGDGGYTPTCKESDGTENAY